MNLIYTRTQPPKKPRIEEDLKTPERLQMELDACGASIERDIPKTTRIIKCMIAGGTGEFCECKLGTARYYNPDDYKYVNIDVLFASGYQGGRARLYESRLENGIEFTSRRTDFGLDTVTFIKCVLLDINNSEVSNTNLFFVVTDQTEPQEVPLPQTQPYKPLDFKLELPQDTNTDLYVTPEESTDGMVPVVIIIPQEIREQQICIYLGTCTEGETIKYTIENFSVTEGTYEVQQEDVQNGFISIQGEPQGDNITIKYTLMDSETEYTETIEIPII